MMEISFGGNLIAYNNSWGSSSFTEYSAYCSVKKLNLNHSLSIYIAFPWSTYIDLLASNRFDDPCLMELQQTYKGILESMEGMNLAGRNIVTTCQHVLADKYINVFHDIALTDLFWSQKSKSVNKISSIRIHAFPVYFNDIRIRENSIIDCELDVSGCMSKQYLCSYGYSSSAPEAETQLHQRIQDFLFAKSDAFIGTGIHENAGLNVIEHQSQYGDPFFTSYANQDFNDRYVEGLKFSLFSFCPFEAGPNPLRLWHSISLMSIPIVLSDNLDVGADNSQLWLSSCLFFSEDTAISDIYECIREILLDKSRLNSLLVNLKQLRAIYFSDYIPQSLLSFLLNPYISPRIHFEWSSDQAFRCLSLYQEIIPNNSPFRGLCFDHMHANLTPFGYPQLLSYARNFMLLENLSRNTKVFISGVSGPDSHESCVNSLSQGFFHLSEEPLWDLLFNCSFDGNYAYQGYCNGLYDDLAVPYFLLTDSKYVERYLQRYKFILDNYSITDLLEEWSKSKFDVAALCEFRNQKRWDARSNDLFDQHELLCRPRTSLFLELLSSSNCNVFVAGKGWNEQAPVRHSFADWHLDKLINTPRSVLLSAIENVEVSSYLTEKPFDSLAMLSLPIVCWSKNHIGYSYLERNSFLNLHEIDRNEWSDCVLNFSPSEANASAFLASVKKNYLLFSDVGKFHQARSLLFRRIAQRIKHFSESF